MGRSIPQVTLALLTLLVSGVCSAAELQTKRVLTLDAARQMAAAGEQFARKHNWNVAITVLDDGGHLLYFQRMDGVQLGSIEVSMRKAESAIKFLRPSKAFADDVVKRPQVMILPGAFPFEGGLPIQYQGQIIGSIGVSGVTAEQDGMIAKAAVDALPAILKR